MVVGGRDVDVRRDGRGVTRRECVVVDRRAAPDQRRHDDDDGEAGEQARPETAAAAGGRGRPVGRGPAPGPASLEMGFAADPSRRSCQVRTYSEASDDVATDQGRDGRAEILRRRVTMAGHRGGVAVARRGLADPDPGVQVAALGTLARLEELQAADVEAALATGRPARRRAVEVALRARGGAPNLAPRAIAVRSKKSHSLVVVGAAWFLAERRTLAAVPELAATATGHEDARCREAAVAALGAIGDPAGLPAVLSALTDVATVRRRATVAPAGFDDPRVTPALRAATGDRELAGAPGGRRVARRSHTLTVRLPPRTARATRPATRHAL